MNQSETMMFVDFLSALKKSFSAAYRGNLVAESGGAFSFRWPFDLVPRSRWNGVDLNPAFLQHAKEMESDGVHQITQTLGPNTKSVFFFFFSFFGQYPPPLKLYLPHLSSIYLFLFTFDLFTFELLHTNQFFSSCRLFFLSPAILLTFQFHSSSISPPLLSSWSGL